MSDEKPDPKGESAAVDLAQAIKRMKENKPALLEFEQLRAENAMTRYNLLRAQGFTHDDAITIVAKTY